MGACMRFRCSSCRFVHDAVVGNALKDPRGTTASVPWFVEPNGLQISATVCLRCGTISGTHGSPVKALFTLGASLLTTKYTLRPQQVAELVYKDPTSVPGAIVSLLQERGFLSPPEREVRFGDLMSAEEGERIVQLIEGTLLQLVAFCDAVVGGELSERSLELFLGVSDDFEKAGEQNVHTAAGRMLRDLLDATSSTDVLRRAEELRLQLSSSEP